MGGVCCSEVGVTELYYERRSSWAVSMANDWIKQLGGWNRVLYQMIDGRASIVVLGLGATGLVLYRMEFQELDPRVGGFGFPVTFG